MLAFSDIGKDAITRKGWLGAHKWLLLRRVSQLVVLGLFLLGPLAGIWIIQGNLSSSLLLETVPMTEPLLMLQMLAAGFIPATTALIGFLVVMGFYVLVGGRVYCAWVCPLNMLTDGANWLRERLGVRGGARFSRQLRLWLLALVLVLATATGGMAYEMFNPVSIVQRGLIFGVGMSWSLLLALFVFDFLLARHGWCGHLCPMGALYGLIGRLSLVRVRADRRQDCNDCMDCFAVCPEPQVIKWPLKGADRGASPVILAGDCTNCGRCIDVCGKDVFGFGLRFNRGG
jgi:ferredoxin-type protein NapH